MNPEIKEKWLEDLRSGNFRKGTSKLHRESTDQETGQPTHEFCCLGVLCEQAVAAGVAERVRRNEGYGGVRYVYFNPNDEFDASEVYPPKVVMDWAGLPSDNPQVDLDPETERTIIEHEGNGRASLANLNDDHYTSFEPIADKIADQL